MTSREPAHFAGYRAPRWPTKAVEKRYPDLDRIICATPLSIPLNLQLEDLARFEKEVFPTFRDTRTAAAAQ